MTIEEAIKHGEEQLEIFGGEHKEFIRCALDALKRERKKGRWVWDGCQDKCTCCGVSLDDQLYDNYCANCGAEMEGSENEDRVD